jgi:hypothetical protein
MRLCPSLEWARELGECPEKDTKELSMKKLFIGTLALTLTLPLLAQSGTSNTSSKTRTLEEQRMEDSTSTPAATGTTTTDQQRMEETTIPSTGTTSPSATGTTQSTDSTTDQQRMEDTSTTTPDTSVPTDSSVEEEDTTVE